MSNHFPPSCAIKITSSSRSGSLLSTGKYTPPTTTTTTTTTTATKTLTTFPGDGFTKAGRARSISRAFPLVRRSLAGSVVREEEGSAIKFEILNWCFQRRVWTNGIKVHIHTHTHTHTHKYNYTNTQLDGPGFALLVWFSTRSRHAFYGLSNTHALTHTHTRTYTAQCNPEYAPRVDALQHPVPYWRERPAEQYAFIPEPAPHTVGLGSLSLSLSLSCAAATHKHTHTHTHTQFARGHSRTVSRLPVAPANGIWGERIGKLCEHHPDFVCEPFPANTAFRVVLSIY